MTDTLWGLPDPDIHADFYADVPFKRLIAWIVDTLVILLLTAVIVPFTAFTGLFFLPLLAAVVSFAYRTITMTGKSATWGMRLVAIEFRTRTGQRFDLGTAVMHTFLYSVFFSFLIPQVASIILILTGPRRQALHDLLLGTAAVNRAATT
ncbi:RDD family protein [Actibacterium lipolyticum]|uniref:RDD family protein n=1 Tax=Actibacterium lipolyticum TaxID=1524263 RepID=A0A238KHH6_9RHOB|nr:RDD family protein [Actibacterium lipolyticum]SMX42309.1 RDD family protein [Actibacterium lipolyticum]